MEPGCCGRGTASSGSRISDHPRYFFRAAAAFPPFRGPRNFRLIGAAAAAAAAVVVVGGPRGGGVEDFDSGGCRVPLFVMVSLRTACVMGSGPRSSSYSSVSAHKSRTALLLGDGGRLRTEKLQGGMSFGLHVSCNAPQAGRTRCLLGRRFREIAGGSESASLSSGVDALPAMG